MDAQILALKNSLEGKIVSLLVHSIQSNNLLIYFHFFLKPNRDLTSLGFRRSTLVRKTLATNPHDFRRKLLPVITRDKLIRHETSRRRVTQVIAFLLGFALQNLLVTCVVFAAGLLITALVRFLSLVSFLDQIRSLIRNVTGCYSLLAHVQLSSRQLVIYDGSSKEESLKF
jgi:hypothetical protein